MCVCQRKGIVIIGSSKRLTSGKLSMILIGCVEGSTGKANASLTVGLPLDLVDFVSRCFLCNAEDLLPIQSVDMNALVNRRQRNQVHSWAVCQKFRIDCGLHQLLGQWISHPDRTRAEGARSFLYSYMPRSSTLDYSILNFMGADRPLRRAIFLGAVCYGYMPVSVRSLCYVCGKPHCFPLDSCCMVSATDCYSHRKVFLPHKCIYGGRECHSARRGQISRQHKTMNIHALSPLNLFILSNRNLQLI